LIIIIFDMTIKDAVRTACDLIELSAMTSPRMGPRDVMEILVLQDEDRAAIGDDMLRASAASASPREREWAEAVLKADALLLIGLLPHKGVGMDCGGCGMLNCADFNAAWSSADFAGPNCALLLSDLGAAIGSASRTAMSVGMETRALHMAGVSARRLCISRASISIGLTVSIPGNALPVRRERRKIIIRRPSARP